MSQPDEVEALYEQQGVPGDEAPADVQGQVVEKPIEDDIAWLRATFEAHNQAHFGGALQLPPITVEQTPHGTSGATYVEGGLVTFVFSPRLMQQDRQWPSDTLLHEMVHLELIADNGDGDAAHGARFVARANQIGKAIGVENVVSESSRAKSWPQSVRKAYPPWDGDDCPVLLGKDDAPEDLVVLETDLAGGDVRSAEDGEGEELVVLLPVDD